MCGIFGVMTTEKAGASPERVRRYLRHLFLLSESRGKEAAGQAILVNGSIHVLKSDVPASTMIRSSDYQDLLRDAFAEAGSDNPALAAIGHSRLVTTGVQQIIENNQPVVAGDAVGIHNGIIVNHDQLWQEFPHLERKSEVDSEVIPALIREFYKESGSLVQAVRKCFQRIRGAASVAILFQDLDYLVLATNNGSLYRFRSEDRQTQVFASERWILKQFLDKSSVRSSLGEGAIEPIAAGQANLVHLKTLDTIEFALNDESIPQYEIQAKPSTRSVVDHSHYNGSGEVIEDAATTSSRVQAAREKYPHDYSLGDNLKRCTRCILPSTMTFIDFDKDGVCNYCRDYPPLVFGGREALEKDVAPYRKSNGEPDCVVGLSGGRDSMYGLHYLKTQLGMNPVAFTYDWGMVTDLARRNISRICGKLGVEHILISADIAKKRKYVMKNVAAWLKKPDLGTIPLFMAGDKQYFYYANQVKKQTGAGVIFLCENMLEKANFKAGFAGVRPHYKDKKYMYTLPLSGKLKMLAYYGKAALKNPAYFNSSLLDSMWAFACYYVIDRTYLNLYNYFPWIEEDIVGTLINDYDFELSPDTVSTWRIGDGTSAFYNYIYYNVTGFTENDAFRSNQIREGLMDRDRALELIREENRPRYAEIDWYIRTIKLDMDLDQVCSTILSIPKRMGRNP